MTEQCSDIVASTESVHELGGDWVDVAATAEVSEGSAVQVVVDGTPLALYRVDGIPYASQDVCTHEFAFMSQGFVDGDCIECPLHQALFHIPTGEVRDGPATCALKTYRVNEAQGRLLVRFDGPPEENS